VSQAPPATIRRDTVANAPAEAPFAPPAATTVTWWQRLPAVPLVLTAILFAFIWCPRIAENQNLVNSFIGVAAGLFGWELILWVVARKNGRLFRIEYVPVKSHYVQACVQFSIMLYWGWHWPVVYEAFPLIAAQIVFLYSLEALLTWSRGRTWRLGFGPLPIIISTNLLLWFRDDWFYLQFLMLTTGALGKQFITWQRDGRTTHIFNPSAFGQFIFALGLIATGTTKTLTWGSEIAQTFEAPHMLIVIFLGGLVVQSLFHVTLMTVAATVTLVLVNLIYTQITGVYFFVSINVAAPIFLGLHLLITDPATSPRTNLGRVMFGVLYALGYSILFRVLDLYGVPLFWDKLLPVPILNLCVPLIDRWVRSGAIGRMNHAWESILPTPKLNLVHMACWAALFITLEVTGFVEAPHPGNSIPFWKQAFVEGKPHAGHSLVLATGAQAEGGGSGAAYNELGVICMEGKIVNKNHGAAAKHFAKACELRDACGCANVAVQFLFLGERRSDADVANALDLLEQACAADHDRRACFLVGAAYETGRGRPWDKRRAIELYERCGDENLYAAKGLARIALSGTVYDLLPVAPTLQRGAAGGDAESHWYLAYMHRSGNGVPLDLERAREHMDVACRLKMTDACAVLAQPDFPPFTKPIMVVPSWFSAFPLEAKASESNRN
jgi:TPR repeat protein